MAIIKCSKGHYYDNTKFSQCPHCGVLPIMEQEQQQEAAKPRRFSFFHRSEGKKQEAAAPALKEDEDVTVAMPVASAPFLPEDDDDDHTVAMPAEPVLSLEDDEDDDHTVAMPKAQEMDLWESDDDDDHTVAIPKEQEMNLWEDDEDDDHTVAVPKEQEMSRWEEEDDDHTIAVPKAQEMSRWAGEEDDDRTIAIPKAQEAVPQMAEDDDDRTIALPKTPVIQGVGAPVAEKKQAGFIAGWLVCVNGPERGCDYRLYKGFNRLGSGERADILVGDPGLAEVALAVVYDDKSNAFFAVEQPGGRALLNGGELQGAVRISSGDLVKAGESEFEFVAFCREGRVWDSYE
ncbi:hypothetical protein D3Z51_03885 [Clostridiaceae bacterium]|nr:hypothetical protein [Clostridiaceae bacterium]RKI13345.1 hypothetical protein D7V81_10360 [bacterium 1XD21-70]